MWSSQTFSILLVLRRAWLKVHFPSPGPSQPRYRQTMFGAACSANFFSPCWRFSISALATCFQEYDQRIQLLCVCIWSDRTVKLMVKTWETVPGRERFQNNHFPYNSAQLLSASQLDEGTERVRKLTFLSHHDIFVDSQICPNRKVFWFRLWCCFAQPQKLNTLFP